ncbi:aKG-HExxH-type peptide beta-hydroxylase [Gandjariella thermophila]|uniref:HEXXH motif domain-containing protein n=1 Tax=Gandjariella thermophila TaxID=1931992 RepID=A0A4D4J794_9PSEU|nr:HEXXH motif-containing putative peptide modification protein [Gandjariella thermophila]GDY30548.1 hypothetical protein GTS_21810 [Gandjariella thermophila]
MTTIPPQVMSHIHDGATYYPDNPAEYYRALRKEVVSLRQSTMVAAALRANHRAGGHPAVQAFVERVRSLAESSTDSRLSLMTHPAFLVWLRQVATLSDAEVDGPPREEALHWLGEFHRVCDRCLGSGSGPTPFVENRIPVRRDDVDPLIAEIAPPTYDFSPLQGTEGVCRAAAWSAYPLGFFAEAASVALRRCGAVWPELAEMVPHFVHTIVHVPDGEFRSASAARYTGVVFLAADDQTLLELEESLVHEFGHQVLYWVMELDPVILNDTDTEFALPWSGAERDFYGFYHAFYIYILLALYYDRVRKLRPTERDVATTRLHEIATGLSAAIPEINRAGRFTPLGRAFTDNLCRAATGVIREAS